MADSPKRLVSFLASLVVVGIFAYSVTTEKILGNKNISPEVGFVSYSKILKGTSIPASCESGFDHWGECGYGFRTTFPAPTPAPDPTPTPAPTPTPTPSPSCSYPYAGQSCTTSANACGQTNTGVYDCSGNCSAGVPANPANYGQSCTSPANACGQVNTGTYQCDGRCSVGTPANPSYYGQLCRSVPNSCGATNPGYSSCDGSCGITPPPDNSCSSPSFGFEGFITDANGNVIRVITEAFISLTADANGNIISGSSLLNPAANSRTVNRGNRCQISWSASSATSCTLTGSGVNRSGLSGTIQTPRIGVNTVGTSVYTLTCYNGNVVSAQKRFTCNLNPEFSETL